MPDKSVKTIKGTFLSPALPAERPLTPLSMMVESQGFLDPVSFWRTVEARSRNNNSMLASGSSHPVYRNGEAVKWLCSVPIYLGMTRSSIPRFNAIINSGGDGPSNNQYYATQHVCLTLVIRTWSTRLETRECLEMASSLPHGRHLAFPGFGWMSWSGKHY